MTPKEKAKEIILSYIDLVHTEENGAKENMKQCALIDVNNTITALEDMFSSFGIGKREMTNIPFYEEVKQEITNLTNK